MAFFDGFYREYARLAAGLISQTVTLQAQSLKAGMEIAKAVNPVAAAMLNEMEKNPVGWKINGLRKLAAANPFLPPEMVARMPDSVGFQWGLGEENKARESRNAPDRKEIAEAAPDPVLTMRRFLERDTDKPSKDFREAVFKASIAEPWRNLEAFAFLTDLQAKDHQKAGFRDLISDSVIILDEENPVSIENIKKLDRPYAGVMRFSTPCSEAQAPDSGNVVYLKAPMSGHFATLLYNVIENYLNAGFTVYVEDKKDASLVQSKHGSHGIEEQVSYDIQALAYIFEREKTRAAFTAICQAAVPAVIASAVLAMDKEEYRPDRLFIASAPLDISINPSLVNKYARMIPGFIAALTELETVPPWKPGAWQTVRAGARQVAGFEAGNPGRFLSYYASVFNYIAANKSGWDRHKPLLQKEIMEALADPGTLAEEKDFLGLLAFLVEYKTTKDMGGQAFMDAWILNFARNFIAEDEVFYKGRKVDFTAIDHPVLTADATDDDISSIGQTMAFHRKQFSGDKRALIIPEKGHFWWGGGTAKDIFWPLIFAWHKTDFSSGKNYSQKGNILDAYGQKQGNPRIPDSCSDPENLIKMAASVHRKNRKLERRKAETGGEFSITLTAGRNEFTIPFR